MKHLLLAFTIILAFAGCTPYQESGFLGGVSATQISSRVFQIRANGNAYTSGARIRDYTLLKASEIALENGYAAFRVVDAQDISTTGTYTTPGTANSSTTGQINEYGSFTANTTTTYTAPRTTTYIKPGQAVHIYLLTDKEAWQADAYNAKTVYSQLASKYKRGKAITNNQQKDDAPTKNSYKAALKKWQPLAEQGDAEAQYELGVAYYYGDGTSQNYQEAIKWTRLSAEQGYVKAQYNLGLLYYDGTGVSQDYQEAMKWWRMVAEQGYASGQHGLGLIYLNGEGVPQDYIRAYMWVSLAALRANSRDVHLRENIAKSMTPEQIVEAKKLSGECIKKNYKGC